MYKSRAEAVREWLQAYRAAEEELDDLLDRIRELRGRITGIKAQEITDMPKSPGQGNPMETYIIKLEAMEGAVGKRLRDHERDREAIVGLVEQMVDADKRGIIMSRYVYGMEWAAVQARVYGSSAEAERRRMFRAHDEALEWMGRNWEKK